MSLKITQVDMCLRYKILGPKQLRIGKDKEKMNFMFMTQANCSIDHSQL